MTGRYVHTLTGVRTDMIIMVVVVIIICAGTYAPIRGPLSIMTTPASAMQWHHPE